MFFIIGLMMAVFSFSGKVALLSEVFMMYFSTGVRTSAHSLSKKAGMGSRSQNLSGRSPISLCMSSLVTSVNMFSFFSALTAQSLSSSSFKSTGMVDAFASISDLILLTFSVKKFPKSLAKISSSVSESNQPFDSFSTLSAKSQLCGCPIRIAVATVSGLSIISPLIKGAAPAA